MRAGVLIYKIVSSIPKGKVSTYARIARLSGSSSPRVIDNILHINPSPKKIPCHRVVNRKGQLAKNLSFGGAGSQAEKLENEGSYIKFGKSQFGEVSLEGID